MKKLCSLILASMLFLMTACSSKEPIPTDYPEVNALEGVTLSLKEETLKKNEAVFILQNNTDEAISYPIYEFHMEQKKDGEWQEYTGTKESSWGDNSTELAAGNSIELGYNWKNLCGSLSNDGEYRFILPVNDSPLAVELNLQ